jgi:hypothetical protein
MYPIANHSMYSVNGVEIVRILIQTATEMAPSYTRPYVANVTDEALQVLMSDINGSSAIVPGTVATAAGMILQPSTAATGEVQIPHGWHTPRYRFVLFARLHKHNAPPVMQVVSGYTEYKGVSHTGRLDPEMCFFVNGTDVYTDTSSGAHSRALESSQVLYSLSGQGVGDPSRECLQRPQDVLMYFSSDLDPTMDFTGNTTKFLGTVPIKNHTRHNSPARYMADLLSTARAVSSEDALYGAREQISATMHANPLIRNTAVSRDGLIATIAAKNGTNMMRGYFTMNDLMLLDPNAPNVVHPMSMEMSGAGGRDGIDWRSEDPSTVFATVMASGISSYMRDMGVHQMHFVVATGAEPNIVTCNSLMAQYDYSTQLDRWKFIVNTELLTAASQCYPYGTYVRVDMTVDLFGITTIHMWVDGIAGEMIYSWPSFCDSLNSLAISRDHSGVQNLYNQIGICLSQVS